MDAPVPEASVPRPATGPGHYLRDVVYGALDGCITTFAIVAGVAGAELGVGVVLALGLANLAADGLSMAASNYLGIKSELEQQRRSVRGERPLRHAFATFAAFVAVGAIPLAAYLAPLGGSRLVAGSAAAGVALFAVGALRARFIPSRPAWLQGFEMLAIGAAAGGAAYGIGLAAHTWLGA